MNTFYFYANRNVLKSNSLKLQNIFKNIKKTVKKLTAMQILMRLKKYEYIFGK